MKLLKFIFYSTFPIPYFEFTMFNYIPKQETNNPNVSPTSPWKIIFQYVGALLLIFFILYIFFLGIANYAKNFISLEEEKQWFGNSLTSEFGEQNQIQTEYVQAIAQKISDEDIHVISVCNEDINAFALPGGNIVILSGIIDTAQSENEVAFVIAHEIAHTQNRDVLKKIITQTPLVFAQAIFLSDIGIPFSNIIDLPYSKKAEMNADTYAVNKIQKSYNSLGNIKQLFEKMHQGMPDILVSLSTHPRQQKRIQNIQTINDDDPEKIISIPQNIKDSCA